MPRLTVHRLIVPTPGLVAVPTPPFPVHTLPSLLEALNVSKSQPSRITLAHAFIPSPYPHTPKPPHSHTSHSHTPPLHFHTLHPIPLLLRTMAQLL